MYNFLQKNKINICIFLLALAVRLFLFSINFHAANGNLVNTIHGDDGYYEISQGILHGNGFTGSVEPPYKPNPLRPPVWPFLIAGIVKIFGSYWAVAFFELIIGSLIPVFGMLIAEKLFASKKISLGTGLLLSLEPYCVLLSSSLYSETIFTFLFLVFFYFLVCYFENKNTRNLVWMSVFLGLATMAKLTIQYIPIMLVFVMLYEAKSISSKRVWKDISVMIGIFALLITPWVIRNYFEFGRIGLSAQPSFNLYVYLAPTVLSIDNHSSFATEVRDFVRRDNFNENDINLSNGNYYAGQAIEVLKQHKVALLKSAATTIVTFFTHDGLLTVFQNAGIIISNPSGKSALGMLTSDPVGLIKIIGHQIKGWGFFIFLARIVWIIITVLFFVGVWRIFRNKKASTTIITVLLLVAYFASTTAINGYGVNARFKVPIDTFLFAFALYGLFSLKRHNTTTTAIRQKGP